MNTPDATDANIVQQKLFGTLTTAETIEQTPDDQITEVENIGIVDGYGNPVQYALDRLIIDRVVKPAQGIGGRYSMVAWCSGGDKYSTGNETFKLNAEAAAKLRFQQGIGIEAIRDGRNNFGLRATVRHLAFGNETDSVQAISINDIAPETNDRYSRNRTTYIKEGIDDLLNSSYLLNAVNGESQGDIFEAVNTLIQEVGVNEVWKSAIKEFDTSYTGANAQTESGRKVRSINAMMLMIEDLVRKSSEEFLSKTDRQTGVSQPLFEGLQWQDRVRIIEGIFGPAIAEVMKGGAIFNPQPDSPITVFDLVAEKYRTENMNLYQEMLPDYTAITDSYLKDWNRYIREMPVEGDANFVNFMAIEQMLPHLGLAENLPFPYIGNPAFHAALTNKFGSETASRFVEDYKFMLANLFRVRLPEGGANTLADRTITHEGVQTPEQLVLNLISTMLHYQGGYVLSVSDVETIKKIVWDVRRKRNGN